MHTKQGVGEHETVCVNESESVCVCERERECVCVCVSESECVCVCEETVRTPPPDEYAQHNNKSQSH